MKKSLFLFWATIGFVYFAGPIRVHAASRYQLDAVHSTVGFVVKHTLFSTVRGKFNDVRATAQIDEKSGSLSSVNTEISVASVDTDNAKRDGHLIVMISSTQNVIQQLLSRALALCRRQTEIIA